MNTINLDLSDPAFADLKEKRVDESLDLTISAKVTKNDGKNLVADVEEVESLDHGYDDGSEDDEPAGEDSSGEKGGDVMKGHKPVAIIALGIKGK